MTRTIPFALTFSRVNDGHETEVGNWKIRVAKTSNPRNLPWVWTVTSPHGDAERGFSGSFAEAKKAGSRAFAAAFNSTKEA